MGLFGCTHKTVSIGVPLINTIYHGNPSVGLYALPSLIWNPMQLVIGSLLAQHLAAFVAREHERLGIVPMDNDDGATTLPHSKPSSTQQAPSAAVLPMTMKPGPWTERDALLTTQHSEQSGPPVQSLVSPNA